MSVKLLIPKPGCMCGGGENRFMVKGMELSSYVTLGKLINLFVASTFPWQMGIIIVSAS